MTLVGKSGRVRDFRQRKLGLTQHALRSFQPPTQKITVRRDSHRLVECPCEMMNGKPAIAASPSSPISARNGFDVLADAMREYQRQASIPSWLASRLRPTKLPFRNQRFNRRHRAMDPIASNDPNVSRFSILIDTIAGAILCCATNVPLVSRQSRPRRSTLPR
jgi:hypothetical protein